MGPSLPRCFLVSDNLEMFTGVHTATTEQYKDLRPSTQGNSSWCSRPVLEAPPPIAGYQPERLVSIASEVVAETSANCDNIVNVCLAAASKRSHSTAATR